MMLSVNQIKRLMLHTKRHTDNKDSYYRGLMDAWNLVLVMNENDVNNKPLNKEQDHELSLPIRHGHIE